MIVVVDYGAGNLRSVEKALRSLGHAVLVTEDPAVVRRAEAVVLPGVGAAADTMRGLSRLGLDAAVCEYVHAGRPFLGVCMGLQGLLTGSEEGGWQPCLDLVPGRVRRLPDGLKVPHMGWNTVRPPADSVLFDGLGADTRFYFVHSYAVQRWELTPEPPMPAPKVTWANHGSDFVAAAENGPLSATQFHPEKSGDAGAHLLTNWLKNL